MVFQKRMDSGSIGYQIPKMPRFPRSARGKRLAVKKVEVNQMRPFDLLATVAGELLAKRDNGCSFYDITESTIPINKTNQVKPDNGSPSKSVVFDQGSCESSFFARFISHGQVSFNFEEHLSSPEERNAASALALVKCEVSEEDVFSSSLSKNVIGLHNLDSPMDVDTKATAPVSSESCAVITPVGDHHSVGRSSSFPSVRDGIELLVDRDDDENSSERTHRSNMYSAAFKQRCIGDSRVRKMMASKYWKAGLETINDGELWNDDEEIKPIFRSRKLCYTRQRTKRCSFKRRKLFERCSFSASKGSFGDQGLPDPLVKDGIKLDSIDPHADINGDGRSSSTTGHSSSYESVDNHVKLSIKSFRVPELFIEIPANATVGSLKRTVMEAVTAILSGGLRIGVLHRGKKIRDDNKTILQAGISNMDKLDNLGFALEPNPRRSTAPCNSLFGEPEPINKFHAPVTPALGHGAYHTLNPTANCTEGDLDSVHSPTNPSSSLDRMDDNSKALVPLLSVNPEDLAVVPLSKTKRSEMIQRRIRRPFSVSEVEALVQAVEMLGTGRWRDVKLKAFDNAMHRTYVDLKDKWKTLVHTARISPQQRRGEPVPQDLLDRVLSAHDYWSRQQAKTTRLAEQCLRPA